VLIFCNAYVALNCGVLIFCNAYVALNCGVLIFCNAYVALNCGVLIFCNAYVALNCGVLIFFYLLFITFLLILCNFVTYCFDLIECSNLALSMTNSTFSATCAGDGSVLCVYVCMYVGESIIVRNTDINFISIKIENL